MQRYAVLAILAGVGGRSMVDAAAGEFTVPAKYTGYVATAAPNLTVASNLQTAYEELKKK
jgi:hypothetical protein